MTKREQPGVVRAWVVDGFPWLQEGDGVRYEVYACSRDRAMNHANVEHKQLQRVLIVQANAYDVVPKRPRPAKKKAKKKSPSHDEGPPFGFLVPSSNPTKKKMSRK